VPAEVIHRVFSSAQARRPAVRRGGAGVKPGGQPSAAKTAGAAMVTQPAAIASLRPPSGRQERPGPVLPVLSGCRSVPLRPSSGNAQACARAG
jgi:hypothetical protein